MGGAPRNPAPRSHFLARIAKPLGCHRTDAPSGKSYRRVPTPLRSTSPFSAGLAQDARQAAAQGGQGDLGDFASQDFVICLRNCCGSSAEICEDCRFFVPM